MRKKSKPKTNCRDGLKPKDEIQARRLKAKLLDEEQRGEVTNLIAGYWDEYLQLDFRAYLKVRDPALDSACKRANVAIKEAKTKEFLQIG